MSRNRAEVGAETFEKFRSWVRRREQNGDHLDYVKNGKLNRSEVARELGFGRAAFAQNPAMKQLVLEIDELWGSQKPLVIRSEQELFEAQERANDRIKRTEASNSRLLEKIATLEAENRQLRIELSKIRDFKTARSAFLETTKLLK